VSVFRPLRRSARRALAVAAPLVLLLPAVRAGAQDTTAAGVSVRLAYPTGTRPGVIVLPVRGAAAGAAGDSIRAILQRDLDYGDRVTVIVGSEGDALAGATSGALNWALAQRLGAAAVVQPSLNAQGGLHLAVHDVGRKAVLAVRDFPLAGVAPDASWRQSVHAASDEAERWLTGVRGVASSHIAFVRERRVWVVDSDGENARAVSDAGALSPAWHPSGRAVVHSVLTDRGKQQIVARELAGGSRVLASSGVTNITPTVSPDGETVVFANGQDRGVDLFAVPFAGGSPRRITVGRGTDNMSPSFAPDGRRVAFASGRLGHPEVYITDADGTNAELLTQLGVGEQSYRSNPDWSPDGRLVAFQSLLGGQFQVMAIGLRDRGVKQLTSEGRNEDPSWAPDSRHMVVTSTRTGQQQLFVVDVETRRARQLTRGGGGARMGAWSPWLPPGAAARP
jgi:TolB protein